MKNKKHLKKYKDFLIEMNIESGKSGVFSVYLNNKEMIFYLKYLNKKILIMLNNEIYQELTIEIPDSNKLDDNEFFINPDVDYNIIKTLTNENFIEKTEKKSIAGDKKTYSYRIV